MKLKFLNTSYCCALIAIVGLSCSPQETQEQTNTVPKKEGFILQRSSQQQRVSLPAELKPYESAMIYPKTSGFVNMIAVDRGSKVNKGDILARLEAPEINAQQAAAAADVSSAQGALTGAEASFQVAKDTYDRITKASATKGAVSESDLLRYRNQMANDSAALVSANYALEAARSQLNASKELTAYLTIRAPFSGTITQRNNHPGDLLSNQGNRENPIFRLENNQTLRLEIAVPERYTQHFAQGDTISFETEAMPGKSFQANISRQSGAIDAGTRTEIIEADVDNADQQLKSGSFAQAHVNFRAREGAFWVPASAILRTMEDQFVIRINDDTAERVPVKRGLKSGDQIEITGDLSAGDQLLMNPSEDIDTGDQITVKIKN